MNRVQGLMTAGVLCMAASALGQNLLSNPGFEDGGNGWTLFTQGGSVAVGQVTYPTSGALTGTRYARVEVTQPAESSAENWHLQLQPAGWEAGIGATYEFKFWAKSEPDAPIHVSVQGSDWSYITGTSFGLTSEWAEYSFTHFSEAEGTAAVRFHVYVAETAGVYSFDDFSVTALTAGVRGTAARAQDLRVRRESGNFVVSLGTGVSGAWKAELVDLRGAVLSTATGSGEGALRLAAPREGGAYIVRVSAGTRAWVRKVSVL